MVSVATPQDEREWVEFARKNTVRAVEKRAAASKSGDGPGEKPYGGSSVRFPHELLATPVLHQLIECWKEVLSKRWERPVTVFSPLAVLSPSIPQGKFPEGTAKRKPTRPPCRPRWPWRSRPTTMTPRTER